MASAQQLTAAATPGGAGTVFDNYTRGIRGNVVRGVSDFLGTWTDCERVLRYSVVISYIITFLVVLLLLAIVFKFNSTFLILLTCAITVISVYQSLLVSKKSCYTALGLSDDKS